MSWNNKERLPIITISREYGAGGRTIAKKLSEKLNIPWYDSDFVKLTAETSGYSEEIVADESEEISSFTRWLESMLNNVVDYTSSHDAIFLAQKEVMLKLAKEPCIIVGRCGNVILREAGIDSFDIFLHADIDVRIERAKNLVGSDVTNIRKYVERHDELRDNYYNRYTKHDILKAQDYTICLDTGVINYDECINLLAGLLMK